MVDFRVSLGKTLVVVLADIVLRFDLVADDVVVMGGIVFKVEFPKVLVVVDGV